ncbi:MAG: ABC transporter ATP-binding protein [Planctomycetota bacterium]|nr:ABC transporter ATP-binding protein [Planctomycetota bacterium]
MTRVRLENIAKTYGATNALRAINLQIEAGELFFLLGPSGCGKSTLLRLIAGLIAPTSGRIFFNDRDVTSLGTERRNAVMCFQSYALWPHMSVRENVRFGLKVRNFSQPEQSQRINEVLRMVQLEPLADRKPNTLSGGQQQRVALARALAVHPDCLLLDEPLSNLDAKLRLEMRSEIRRICKTAGFTTIYVTHDQKEALAVADRIAVLRDGKIVQIGTPLELYERPLTSFVADFLGQTNLIQGKVIGRDDGNTIVQTPLGIFKAASVADPRPDAQVIISIRPQHFRVVNGAGIAAGANQFQGKIIETTFLGESTELVVAAGEQRLKLITPLPLSPPASDVTIEFAPSDAIVLLE